MTYRDHVLAVLRAAQQHQLELPAVILAAIASITYRMENPNG